MTLDDEKMAQRVAHKGSTTNPSHKVHTDYTPIEQKAAHQHNQTNPQNIVDLMGGAAAVAEKEAVALAAAAKKKLDSHAPKADVAMPFAFATRIISCALVRTCVTVPGALSSVSTNMV